MSTLYDNEDLHVNGIVILNQDTLILKGLEGYSILSRFTNRFRAEEELLYVDDLYVNPVGDNNLYKAFDNLYFYGDEHMHIYLPNKSLLALDNAKVIGNYAHLVLDNHLYFIGHDIEKGNQVYRYQLDLSSNTDDVSIAPPKVNFFPTIVSDELKFTWEQKGQVDYIYQIVNQMGLPVKRGILENKDGIDVSDLPAGMFYISTMTDSEVIQTSIFIKE